MIFKNETDWNTRQLRKLCLIVLRKVGINPKWTTLIVEYDRRNDYHGLASLGGCWIKMIVPKPQAQFNVEIFTKILEHEAEHNLGLKHKDMMHWSMKEVNYTKEFEVIAKVKKPKIDTNLKEIRHQKAKAKIKELMTKLKRTQTLLKKWQRKVKYYEKGKVAISLPGHDSRAEPEPQ